MGKLKLSSGSFGGVMVMMSGSSDWQGVCDDHFDKNQNAGNIICRMLGFQQALAVRCCSFYGSNIVNSFALDDIQCNGSETSLENCSYLTTHDCSSSEYAGVSCE